MPWIRSWSVSSAKTVTKAAWSLAEICPQPFCTLWLHKRAFIETEWKGANLCLLMLTIKSTRLLQIMGVSSVFFFFSWIRSRISIFFQILNRAAYLGVLSLLWTVWWYSSPIKLVCIPQAAQIILRVGNSPEILFSLERATAVLVQRRVGWRRGLASLGTGLAKNRANLVVLKIFFTLKLWNFSLLFLSTFVMETEAWYFKMHKRGLVWLTLAAHLIQANGHIPEGVLHLQNCHRDAEVPLRLMLRNTRQCSQ